MAGRSQHLEPIMENQTRFDLNAVLENWRQELAAQLNLASDDRRELETHLRDTIAELRQRGLNEEESFWLARRRVGQPQQLAEEFAKADPVSVWRERVIWVAAGSLFVDFWQVTLECVPLHNWMKHPVEMYIYLLMIYLPPIFVAVLLAVGRMSKLICASARCFRPRLWLVIGVMAFVCMRVSQAFVEYAGLNHVHTPNSNAMEIVWLDLFSGLIWPLALIGLIAWLMPSQNRKTPRRA